MSEQSPLENKVSRIVSIRTIDCSFESPNKMALSGRTDAPTITQRQDGPEVTKVNDEGVYNVKLGVNVTCDYPDNTNVFIAEAKAVATVVISDENDFPSQAFINGTVCDILYNSLRETISSLILSGGFPEYQIQFLSYEQRFLLENADRVQEIQAAQASAASKA